MKRDPRLFLQDILLCLERIERYTGGMSFREFAADEKTVDAVIRNFEIIGEATKNVPESIRSRYPAIPWRDMAGMRDKLIHAYFGVDLEMVWKTAKTRLPGLILQIRQVLKDLEQS